MARKKLNEDFPETEEQIEAGKFSKSKRMKKKADSVRFISFLNLSYLMKKDCEKDYPIVKLLIHYLIAFIAISLTGIFFDLQLVPILILCATYLILGPSLVYYSHRKKYEQKKFNQCVKYIEQMLYSFTRRTKILTALEETRLVTEKGYILTALDYAIDTIRSRSTGEENIYKAALKEIEAVYPCSRVKNLHEFLIDVERVGGRHSTALDIMLDDVREWEVRSNEFQANQKVKGTSLIISIFMSLGTIWFMSHVLPADMGGDISSMMLYQVVTTATLLIMFFLYRLAVRKLTRSWVADDLGTNEARIDADCEKVHKWIVNGKKGAKPIFAMTRVKTELEKAFPRWVMRFSLLASSQPIPVALRSSLYNAPKVLVDELTTLVEAIDKAPASIDPYLNFFADYDVPEVRSMMMMIYSLSEYGVEDIDKHVLSIVKRNYHLQANAEKIVNDESLALFSLYSILPMLLACVVMMVDVGMIVMNMLGAIEMPNIN